MTRGYRHHYTDAERAQIVAVRAALYRMYGRRGSISAFADRAGLPRNTVSRFLNDYHNPHRATLAKMVAALQEAA